MRTKKEISDKFDELNKEAERLIENMTEENKDEITKNLGKQMALLWVLEIRHNI